MEKSIENSPLVWLCSAVLGVCCLPGAGAALLLTVQVLAWDATQRASFPPCLPGLDGGERSITKRVQFYYRNGWMHF